MGHEGDLEIARRISAGDEDALLGVVRDLKRPLLRLAQSFVGKGDHAEDVVQEAWLGLIQGIERYEGRASLRTFVGSIVVNCARKRRAKLAREVLASDDDDGLEGRFNARGGWSRPVSWSPDPEKVTIDRELVGFVQEELEALSEMQRAVLVLKDVEEWSSEEIRNVLGLTETNQRVLLHRARSRLRTALEARIAREPRRK